MSPYVGGGEGGCGVSANEYSSTHGAQINFRDLIHCSTYGSKHMLNMEVYLQRFIWAPSHVMCTAVLIGWDPATPHPPQMGLAYEGAIGQHLFVNCNPLALSLDNVQDIHALWWGTSYCRVTSTSQRTTWLFTQTSSATSLGYVSLYVITIRKEKELTPPPPLARGIDSKAKATCPSKFPAFVCASIWRAKVGCGDRCVTVYTLEWTKRPLGGQHIVLLWI